MADGFTFSDLERIRALALQAVERARETRGAVRETRWRHETERHRMRADRARLKHAARRQPDG